MEFEWIKEKIYEIRGRGVMLDFDLAEIFEVETRVLKQAVRRNNDRFPNDFMFELTESEYNLLKNRLTSQIVISNSKRGGIRYLPFAFTREGVAMLSGVLSSPKAIQANINIMRAFVSVREYLLSHASESVEIAQLRERVLRLEQAKEQLESADEDVRKDINSLYKAIDELSAKPLQLEPNRRLIGYKRSNEK